ncbi:MAG: transglycosylase SLT domain-containing protein [Patescibacteria group bacterium]
MLGAVPALAAEPVIDQNFFVPAPIFTDTSPLPAPVPADPSVPVVPATVPTSTALALPALLQAAHDAQAQLSEGVNFDKITHKNLEQMKLDREISFVFYDKRTTEVVRVDGLFDGKTWKPTTYTSNNFPAVSVKVTGLSTYTYAFTGDDYVILAVRYPRWTEVLKKKKRIGIDEKIAVKTPNQKEFQTPDIAAAGADMLNDVADKAIADLEKRNVMSRAKPGQKLAAVADKNMLTSLYIIEHSSSAELKSNASAVIDRFYINYAVNPTTAYSDQQSYMGAQGIAQFMPATYTRLAKRTDLGLIQDVTKGTRDHVNITKAAFALMDAMEAELPSSLSSTSSIRLAEAVAGSYNAGANRVATLIERDVWFDQIDGVLARTAVKKRSRVPVETLDYVQKLRLVLPVIERRANPSQI